jgi:hypothetical protein
LLALARLTLSILLGHPRYPAVSSFTPGHRQRQQTEHD